MNEARWEQLWNVTFPLICTVLGAIAAAIVALFLMLKRRLDNMDACEELRSKRAQEIEKGVKQLVKSKDERRAGDRNDDNVLPQLHGVSNARPKRNARSVARRTRNKARVSMPKKTTRK